jgi:hypothetical protein
MYTTHPAAFSLQLQQFSQRHCGAMPNLPSWAEKVDLQHINNAIPNPKAIFNLQGFGLFPRFWSDCPSFRIFALLATYIGCRSRKPRACRRFIVGVENSCPKSTLVNKIKIKKVQKSSKCLLVRGTSRSCSVFGTSSLGRRSYKCRIAWLSFTL